MGSPLTDISLQQFRSLYYAMAPDFPHSVLLDSCGLEGKSGGFYLMGFEAQTVVQLRGDHLQVNGRTIATIADKTMLWARLESLFGEMSQNPAVGADTADLPFTGGWVGTMAYGFNHVLEPTVPKSPLGTPLGELYFVRFRHLVLWLPAQNRFAVVSPDPAWHQRLAKGLDQACQEKMPIGQICSPMGAVQASFTPEAFESAVRRIQAHIRQGDLYQANLSIRFAVDNMPAADLFTLYQTLVTRNPSPFSGLFWTPQGVVISNSPERLVRYTAHTQRLETRPIAGTRGRGSTPEEDARIVQVLLQDAKEQAEHWMLVDLERNDLGRVSVPGSVYVPEMGVLERYSHVTHLVSQVEGTKDPRKNRWDILEAVFPGGTITGCPKVRCMEILHHLEPVPRGLYTGSLGYLDIHGNLDFNILIRSLFHTPDQRLTYHAGAGIVADSVPAWEYRECLRKAALIQGILAHDPLTNIA